MMEVVSGDNRSYKTHEAYSLIVNTQLFIGRVSFMLPNQQCQSTDCNSLTRDLGEKLRE